MIAEGRGVETAAAGQPVAFAASFGLYSAVLALDLPATPLAISNATMGPGQIAALRFSNEFAWNGLLGLIVAADPDPRWDKAVSWLAGSSFSLYLVHYPALQFWNAVIPQMDGGILRDGSLLAVTQITCFAFASLFEHRLGAFRKALLRLRQSVQGEVSTVPAK